MHPGSGDERRRHRDGDGELTQGDADQRAPEGDPPGTGTHLGDDVVDQEHVADGEHRPPAGRVHPDRDDGGLGGDVDHEAGARGGAGPEPDAHDRGDDVPQPEHQDQLEQ